MSVHRRLAYQRLCGPTPSRAKNHQYAMQDIIEYKKIATEISLRAIERTISAGGKMFASYWHRYKARDISTYSNYLTTKGTQANFVRNFIYDTKSASLYDIYVQTSFTVESQYGSNDYSGDGLLKVLCSPVDLENPILQSAKKYVITGSAGCGKSLFMKHAFFAVQNLDYSRIPVLIEVRAFNRFPLSDLEDRILNDFASGSISISREQIFTALKSGLFVILLDGMDELKSTFHQHYEAELLTFATKYPLCPILVSTRPMNNILSWAQFNVRQIARLEVNTAQNLVRKLEFDDKVKRRFAVLLRKSLFRTHYELV